MRWGFIYGRAKVVRIIRVYDRYALEEIMRAPDKSKEGTG